MTKCYKRWVGYFKVNTPLYIEYLNTIPVYINSLMIITQHIEVLQNLEVSELCKGTNKVKEQQKKERKQI